MAGWKTWLAAILSILYGIGFCGIYSNNWTEAITYILAGIGLIGVGHKIDKLKGKY